MKYFPWLLKSNLWIVCVILVVLWFYSKIYFILTIDKAFWNKSFVKEYFLKNQSDAAIPEISHCMEKRIFVLRNLVQRTKKIIFSLASICLRFTEISYSLNFPSNENVKKQDLSANAYFCDYMKFSYTIAGRKDKFSYFL